MFNSDVNLTIRLKFTISKRLIFDVSNNFVLRKIYCNKKNQLSIGNE